MLPVWPRLASRFSPVSHLPVYRVTLHKGEAMYISLSDFQWTNTETKSLQ